MRKFMNIPMGVEMPDEWNATFECHGEEAHLIYKESFPNVDKKTFEVMADALTMVFKTMGMTVTIDSNLRTVEIIMKGPRKTILMMFASEIVGQYADDWYDIDLLSKAFKDRLPEKAIKEEDLKPVTVPIMSGGAKPL